MSERHMLKARAQLLMDAPFFGTLAVRLKLKADDEIKTAATDGVHLIYSPKYVDKLSPMELRGLIAHEVMHCALNHTTRRQERDHKKWNVACDYAINNHLIECGFVLPTGGLVDAKYNNLSAEAIYNRLEDDGKSGKQCTWGIVLDAPSGGIEAQSDAGLEAEWQIAVTEAAQVAKARGKLPGNIELFISDIIAPKVDWRTVLWPFITNLSTTDYSWRKPNRAYISEDEYLPSMYEECCGKIAVCIDTSGSITDEELQQFISEVDAILASSQPEEVVLVQCDTDIRDVTVLPQGSRIKDQDLSFKGRGGTAFAPAFKRLYDEHMDLEAIIYLTDLECNDFAECEPYATVPTLWVCTTRHSEAPFGTTVYMN